MQRWKSYSWLVLFCLAFAAIGCKDKAAEARKKKVQALLQQLKSDDAEQRQKAIEECGKLGPYAKPAIPTLVKLLKDDESSVKYAAARALGKTKMAYPSAVIGGLTRALKDSDAQMRIEAVRAISQMGMAALATVGVLRTMLKDPDEDESVKEAIKKALTRIR